MKAGIEELRPMLADLAQHRAGMRLAPVNGQLCLIAYAPVPTPGWSLGIVIPDESLATFVTVGDVVAYLEKQESQLNI